MNIFILTGAGISAESGINTFRDDDGLWNEYKIEEVSSIDGFNKNPNLVIDFHNMLQTDMNSKEPNQAHYAITELMDDDRYSVTLVTQNIDNLHEKAGSKCIHMHGNINEILCLHCGAISLSKVNITDETVCPECMMNAVRPNVVWFGEMPYSLEYINEKLIECDIFIAIGTSGVVQPAAGFVRKAKKKRAWTINVNIKKSFNWDFKEEIVGSASTEVKKLIDKIKSNEYDELVKERKST